MSTLLTHPAKPVRTIYLLRFPGEGDLWLADYCGDNWTSAFRTVPGERWLVRDATRDGDVRRRLPITDEDGLHTPTPTRPLRVNSPDGTWPGGQAA